MMARMTAPHALFPHLLGEHWHVLAAPVRQMHGEEARVSARGIVQVEGATHWPARVLRRLLGLPAPAPAQALLVTIERHAGRENWTRRFGTAVMRSTLSRSPDGSHLHERLGPVLLRFALHRERGAIDWQLRGGRLLGLPLPRACMGTVHSRSGEEDGRYAFDIDVRLPLLGRLVAYRGWLEFDHG